MGAPRRILEAKAFYAVTEFTQRCRGGCASETAPDNDDLELPPIVWTDQSGVITMAAPFLIERALWNFGVQCPNHICRQDSKFESRNPKQTCPKFEYRMSKPEVSILKITNPEPCSHSHLRTRAPKIFISSLASAESCRRSGSSLA